MTTVLYPITNGLTADTDGYFEILGNFTTTFQVGFPFVAIDSNGSPATVQGAVSTTVNVVNFTGSHTEITPDDGAGSPLVIPTPNGSYVTVAGGAYSLEFADPAGSPNTIIVTPGGPESSSTSLVFPGRATVNWGGYFNQNFLNLLENFASPTQPSFPIEGQLWWDKGAAALKIWNGAAFVPVTATGLSLGSLSDVIATVTSGANPGDALRFNGASWDSGFGVNYDEIIIGGSPVSTTVGLTNVVATGKSGGQAFQQVFRNGILQREDVAGFPSSGNYYVFNATTLEFAPGVLNPTDEILVYQV